MYLFELEFSSFPDICPGVGWLDCMIVLFLAFEEPWYHSPQWLQKKCRRFFISSLSLELENRINCHLREEVSGRAQGDMVKGHGILLRIKIGACLSIRHGNPLQYSCLENPMDRGDWWATIHGVAKSRTQLSDLCVCVSLRQSSFHYRQSQNICWFFSPSLKTMSLTIDPHMSFLSRRV